MDERFGVKHSGFWRRQVLRRPWVMFPVMLACSCLGMLLVVSAGVAQAEGSGSGDKTAAFDPSTTRMTAAQCMACHETAREFSHPTERIPSMAVPAMLPLENGRVTCITCHENSSEEHARNRKAGGGQRVGPPLRGMADPGLFCMQCHVDNGVTRKAMHPLGIGSAHLVWVKQPLGTGQIAGATKPTEAALTAAGDDGSRSCLGCHDGTVASDAQLALASGFKGFSLGGGGHPSDVAYDRARPGDRAMRPAAELDKRVRLFNGQVGCQSCHSPYSTLPRLLVMGNEGSKLCLACHEMK